jgi:DNA-binding MarR family transcriptional regulator
MEGIYSAHGRAHGNKQHRRGAEKVVDERRAQREVLGGPDEIAGKYHDACDWADLPALQVNLWLIEAYRSLISGLLRALDSVEPSMSTARYLALRDLFLTEGHRLRQADIQRRGKTSSGSVTRLVDGMEEDRLIARVPHAEDRRTNYVVLTEKGLELCQHLIPAVARYSVDVCQGLNDEERHRFIQMLRLLADGAGQAAASE